MKTPWTTLLSLVVVTLGASALAGAHLFFHTSVQGEGSCGFAAGGSNDYLVNHDTGHAYSVTVRSSWEISNKSGSSDAVYQIPAGGRVGLGCTKSPVIPVQTTTHTVVGESTR